MDYMNVTKETLDNLFTPYVKIRIKSTKKRSGKSSLCRLDVLYDGRTETTINHYWIPNFIVDINGYVGTSDWDVAQSRFREIKAKIRELESEIYRITEEKRISQSGKAISVEITSNNNKKYETWVPVSVIIEINEHDKYIPTVFMRKQITEKELKNLNPEPSKCDNRMQNGNILNYIGKE